MIRDFKIYCAVPHNNRYTNLFENISLYFVLKQEFEPVTFLGYTG
jgi:hypothetical protein